MNKMMRKFKTGRFLHCFIFLFTAVSIGSLSAYLMDGDKAANKLSIGGNRIEILEEFVPPKELTPGTQFTKDVKIKNVGPNDCFVRIKAVFTDSDMEKYCTVNFNTTDYGYNTEDGFYYLKRIIKSGNKTPSLFTTVTLSNEISAEEIKDFDILVYAESYQSEGFTDYAEAWKHYSRNEPDMQKGGYIGYEALSQD